MAFLNVTYTIIPNPLRKYYLRLFGIRIGDGSCIHRGCRFFHVGKLSIGKHSVGNFGCYLDNRRGIVIGDNVGLAHNVKVYTLGHNIDSPDFETKGAQVTIEEWAFIFSNAVIMPGVTIHEGAIVLPCSVVTKDVEKYTVVGGNPAKYLRKRELSTPPVLQLLVCVVMEWLVKVKGFLSKLYIRNGRGRLENCLTATSRQ